MTSSKRSLKFSALTLTLLAAAALPALAAPNEGLALVPVDAAVVGTVRLDQMRTSPLTSSLFHETDEATMDGDAARFMQEAGLDPKRDVDVLTFSLAPPATEGKPGRVLAAFEGRFDTQRLSAAVISRGGVAKGSYILLPNENSDEIGAVAFVNRGLVLAGTEEAVVRALADRKSGGSDFTARSGLGRELGRIEAGSTMWVLVDLPRASRAGIAPEWSKSSTGPAAGVAAALNTVSILGVWATDTTEQVRFGGTAVSYDEETRDLLEDTMRGLIAAWRLAAQEEKPELVTVLRKFEVTQSGDAVSLEGSVPGEMLQKWHSKVQAAGIQH